MVDMARHPSELLLNEAIHINLTSVEKRLNRDTGLEVPGCWVAALRRHEGKTNQTPTDDLPRIPRTPATANDAVYGQKNDAFPLRDIFEDWCITVEMSACFPMFSGW